MRTHQDSPKETTEDTAAQPAPAGASTDARPTEERAPGGVEEFRLVIRKLEMPVRPRGVLAE